MFSKTILALAALATIGTAALVTSTSSADARAGFRGGFHGGFKGNIGRVARFTPNRPNWNPHKPNRPALAPALPASALARPLASFMGLWCWRRHGCSRGPGLRGCPDLRGACGPAPLHLPDQGVHAGQPRGVQGPVHQGDGGSSDRRRGATAEHVAAAAGPADARTPAVTSLTLPPDPGRKAGVLPSDDIKGLYRVAFLH